MYAASPRGVLSTRMTEDATNEQFAQRYIEAGARTELRLTRTPPAPAE